MTSPTQLAKFLKPRDSEILSRLPAAESARIIELASTKPTFDSWLRQTSPALDWTPPHLRLIRHHLNRVKWGLCKRLMINCPPRHGKSEQVTMRAPAYFLELDPRQRFIIGAYNKDFAESFSYRNRYLYRGPRDDTRNRAAEWYTDPKHEGGLRAVGVGVGVAGRGADGIFLDDPIRNRKEAASEAYRRAIWEWYLYDIHSRLEPHGFIVLIMTRWHDDDLAGRILVSPEASRWTVVNLPALARDDDILGRKRGAALWPDRFNQQMLQEKRLIMGDAFEALYQGSPVSEQGAIFLSKWMQRYTTPADHYDLVVQSWDCANKATEISSYGVCTTWGVRRDRKAELLHVFRRRMTYPELKLEAQARGKRAAVVDRPADLILVEDKGNGIALIQDLRACADVPPIIAVEPDADKITRASNESIAYAAGNVLHPFPNETNTVWLPDFEHEMKTFPHAAYADQVDSVSQFLKWLRSQNLNIEGAASTGPRAGQAAPGGGEGDTRPPDGRGSGSYSGRGFGSTRRRSSSGL